MLPASSKTQCAAVRTCEASTTEPVQEKCVVAVACWMYTAHGADCTSIAEPPTTSRAGEAWAARIAAAVAPTASPRVSRLGATQTT